MLAVVLALATPAAAVEDAPPERPDRSDWAGRWILDRDGSDSIRPLLALMEAPTIAHMVADRMTPKLTISLIDDGGLRMVNDSPIQNTTRDLIPDGVARPGKDARGRKIVSSAVWDAAGRLVIRQQNYLDAERIVEVDSTWARVDERLELTIRAEGRDGPVEIRRVFRRLA